LEKTVLALFVRAVISKKGFVLLISKT